MHCGKNIYKGASPGGRLKCRLARPNLSCLLFHSCHSVDPAMRRIRHSTEYESKYSRKLWDEATRSNYFQLADERKSRMLRGTTHAPIHWEHEPEIEVIDISSPEPFEILSADFLDYEEERPPTPRRPKSCKSRSGDNKITSKLSPEPPTSKKTAWGAPSPRPITAESTASRIRDSQKRSTEDSHSIANSDEKLEKRARLPTTLPKSVPPPKSHTPIYRPQSAPNSRSQSRSSFVHVATKNQPPFAMYGNTTGNGTRQTYNVKPDSKEIYSSAIRAKHERERLQLYRKTSEKWRPKQNKAFPTNILNNLPRDIGSWVTEYQGNFKAYAAY